MDRTPWVQESDKGKGAGMPVCKPRAKAFRNGAEAPSTRYVECYRPLNAGWRFSKKAVVPSVRSSVPMAKPK